MQDSVYETHGPVELIKTQFSSGRMYWLRSAETGQVFGGSWTKLAPARRRAKQIAANIAKEAEEKRRAALGVN